MTGRVTETRRQIKIGICFVSTGWIQEVSTDATLVSCYYDTTKDKRMHHILLNSARLKELQIAGSPLDTCDGRFISNHKTCAAERAGGGKVNQLHSHPWEHVWWAGREVGK